jgi:hypothetical protein
MLTWSAQGPGPARAQEKEEILGCLPWAAQALHSFCCLHGWPTWMQSSQAPQTACAAPCRVVNTRLSITIVQATHLCMWGSHLPLSQISHHPLWEDRAVLGLFKTDH